MAAATVQDFTHGSIPKQLARFALPLFLANLLQVVYGMVDMVVVGQALGQSGLSAVAIGGDLVHFLTFLVMGFANAGQVIIARYIGAGQSDRIAHFIGTMSGFLVLCALAVGALAYAFQEELLRLMNTPAEALAGAASYATVCTIGLLFIYGYNTVSAILRGMGDAQHPLLFIAIAAVLNVALDLLFVFGFSLGARGAALATVLSQALSFLLCALFLWRQRDRFGLAFCARDFIRWDRAMLRDFLALGIPMAIKSAAVHISKLFVNSFINAYGVTVSAFAGAANKLASVAAIISNSLAHAGSTMLGQNLAAGRFERVKQTLRSLTTAALAGAALFIAVIVVAPRAVFSVFTSDEAVLALAKPYVPIACLMFLGSALRSFMNALINGSGNSRINLITAILDGIVLRIGLSLLFGLALGMAHFGFWLGDALAGFTPFVIGLVFWLSGRWKEDAVKTE